MTTTTPDGFDENSAGRTHRIDLASFSTSAMFKGALHAALRGKSCEAAIMEFDFGSVIPALVSPPAECMRLIVLLDEFGLPPRNWRESAVSARASYEAWVDMLIGAIDGFASNRKAQLLINTVPQTVLPTLGHLDEVHPDGKSSRIAHLNRRLRELAATHTTISLIESDIALAGIAPSKRSDAKLRYYGRIPFSAPADAMLGAAFADAIVEYGRPRPKVLAIDLDDTLWRGVFGEVGALGVDCGDDFPGNAYKALQEECLRLKSQGLILTLLSKNDPGVLDVFDQHPGMSLRRSDFIASRINWRPKADNIRELASELDLSLDTFLFLDDSPHEREAMRRLAPEVRILDMPTDPALRPGLLRTFPAIWPLRLTDEDAARSEMYSARVGAKAAQAKAANLTEYLKSLEQKLLIEPVTQSGVARLTQMHERTNQFNLTTRRFSEQNITALLADKNRYLLLQGRVSDRFGDHGIVICAVAEMDGARAELVSFLMSCRVIAREVEYAFLGGVLKALTARGVDRLEAEFVPTERNSPAADFLRTAGLTPAAGENGSWVWTAGLSQMPQSEVVQTKV